MECKEECRHTKRTGELLMRAQPGGRPLVLNVHMSTLKVHTSIYTEHGYCYTLHQLQNRSPTTTHKVRLNLVSLSSCLPTSASPL